MKEYPTELIRNVVVVGHGSSGKTSLVEAILHCGGATTRLGKIEDNTTVTDFEDEEQRRKISISTALASFEDQGYKFNLLDTPGFLDFIGEVRSAMSVADAAILVVDAVAGVEVGTELMWQYCDEFNLPRFVVINKIDRDNANFQQVLSEVQKLDPHRKLVPVTLPFGEKEHFSGVVGVFSRKVRPGRGHAEHNPPAELMPAVEKARLNLMEAAAEGDDDLLMKYLDGELLTDAEIEKGFHKAVLAGSFAPVLSVSATAEIGIAPLITAIRRYLPSPAERARSAEEFGKNITLNIADSAPLSLYAFKTSADVHVGKITFMRVMSGRAVEGSRVWNHNTSTEERLGVPHAMRGKEQIAVHAFHAGDLFTVSKLNNTHTGDSLGDKNDPIHIEKPSMPGRLYAVAVRPHAQADSAKMGPTLTRLVEEDPTLNWFNDTTTHETILEGMGDMHVEVALQRAANKFGTHLDSSLPKVAYRETISRKASAQYRHKKQTGGSGQFGEVHLRVEPLTEANQGDATDGNFRMVSEVFGGAISSSYLPAIEKGIRGVMVEGAIAGYPMERIFVAITDGKEHAVDSKPLAFEVAGREAFKLAVQDAGPTLIEPVMLLKTTVPEANMGDILGDLNTRRARVLGMDTDAGKSVVTAEVPQAEIQRYVTDLRSMTQGRGVFAVEYLRHEQVPAHLTAQIIAAHKAAQPNTAH